MADERKRRRWWKVAVWLVVLLVLYVGSFGPTEALAIRLGALPGGRLISVLLLPYRPLQWLKKNSPDAIHRAHDNYLLYWMDLAYKGKPGDPMQKPRD